MKCNDILNCILLDENYDILIESSLNLVPMDPSDPTDNKSVLVHVTVCRRPDWLAITRGNNDKFYDAMCRH